MIARRVLFRSAVVAVIAAGLCMSAITPKAALAQQQREAIPGIEYYAAYGDYYAGEYKDALKGFQRAERGAIKGANGRWIDSIIYHTAVGEVYYQNGHYAKALTQYRDALRQYLQYSTWMVRVTWPLTLAESRKTVAITWGTTRRPGPPRVGLFRDKMPITLGGLQAIPGKDPGFFNNARTFNINVMEVLRAQALATRRYAELVGPTASEDGLLKDLITALEARPTQPNHWSQSMIDVLLGCAYKGAGKAGDAEELLRKGQVADGQFDHPLTAVAMLELADMALKNGEFKKAGELCEEATYSAAMFLDFGGADTVQEAFHMGFIAHLLQGHKGEFPQARAAAKWALHEELDVLAASLLLDSAENAVARRATAEAAEDSASARRLILKTRDMPLAKIGARMNHVNAMIAYQGGSVADGDAALAAALKFQADGRSLWLFHIGLTDTLISEGLISTRRKSEQLYEFVLRDPGLYEWQVDPLEALSKVSIPHEAALEHWLIYTLDDKKGVEKAIEITDRIRRHRFDASVMLGARLTSLRWLLEGPQELLTKDAAARRKNILVEFPHYEELQGQAKQLRTALEQMPLVAGEDADGLLRQQEMFAQLAAISLKQETILREIAVRREDAPLLFPALKTTRQVQEAMPKGQSLLMFYATSKNELYAFLLARDAAGKNQYNYWPVANSAAVTTNIKRLLKELGNHNERRVVPTENLNSDKWKSLAAKVYDDIFKGDAPKLPEGTSELVVVPDGVLWYLPFEILQMPDPAPTERASLLSKFKLRYAPLMCLAHPDARGVKPTPNLVVSLGKLFPGQEDGVTEAMFEELQAAVPEAVALLGETLPAPAAVFSTLFHRLIVLDDLDSVTTAGPYGWSPLAAKTRGDQVDNWLLLPFGGPDQIILPGFHTAAESGLTEKHQAGREVFLSVCAMMANGSRTLLLSRWRPGGKSSYDLVREFVKELPHAAASEAWRRSVFVTSDVPLTPDQEPRMSLGPRDTLPKADHPFFWSGYLLIDTGRTPPAEPAEAAAAGEAAAAQGKPAG